MAGRAEVRVRVRNGGWVRVRDSVRVRDEVEGPC